MSSAGQLIVSWPAAYRQWGAAIDTHAFYRLFFRWMNGDDTLRIPRGVVAAFEHGEDGEHAAIAGLIDQRRAADERRLHGDMLTLRKQLAMAEQAVAKRRSKATASATADARRRASEQLAAARDHLADVQRIDPRPDDGRFSVGWTVPVLMVAAGRRLVRPMRYLGNAFPARSSPGKNPGILILTACCAPLTGNGTATPPEHASEHALVHALEYALAGDEPMVVPCLWSAPENGDGHDLPSLALVTDAAPVELAAAGLQACVIPLTPDGVDAWLEAHRSEPTESDRPLDAHRLRTVWRQAPMPGPWPLPGPPLAVDRG